MGICFYTSYQSLLFNRTNSRLLHAYFKINNQKIKTIVMDDFSVEIFEDGMALTLTIYPPDDANGLQPNVKASSCHYTRADVN